MSDERREKVVRGEIIGDAYEPEEEDPYRWMFASSEIEVGECEVSDATLLLHDGDAVGPVEPWMVEYLRKAAYGRFHAMSPRVEDAVGYGRFHPNFTAEAQKLIAQAIQSVIGGSDE